jgi:protoporphyrinogen oxidase
MKKSTGPIGLLNSKSKNVSIIGAGISGLLIGYFLKKNGFNVSIFEKEARVGGKIGTIQSKFGPAETAANAIFTNDDVLELMDDLKLDYFKAPEALKKYVWRNNKATTPPFKFYEIFRFIFGGLRKIDTRNIEKKSVYDFFEPMLGKYFTREIMSAALGGIYAQPTSVIHFKSLFKTPIKAKTYFGFFKDLIALRKSANKNKASSISFTNGMQDFIDKLKSNLEENIVHKEIKEIEKDQNIIICTDATSAAEILCAKTSISEELSNIKYNSMTTSTVITDKEITYLDKGFGVVIPPEANLKSLGILSNTSIFPKRVHQEGHFSYTFMTKDDQFKANTSKVINDEIQIISDLEPKNIVDIKSTSWNQAIPIYNQNRYESIIKLRSLFLYENKGLVLFGNYIDGISIREIITHAKSFASISLNGE